MAERGPGWLEWVEGGVTAPEGWRAGATYAGVRTYGEEPRYDVGLLASDRPCAVAGIFSRNAVVGAPIKFNRPRVQTGRAQAIVANSGNANTVTGERGDLDAGRMASVAGEHLGVPEELVLVASTGVIGRPLPMDRIEGGIAAIEARADGGSEFARAIMTTDTRPKSRAVRFEADGRTYTIGGVAKGSGMVHPDMATVFCFLTTDAPADAGWLHTTLKAVGDVSINMIDVDMDSSTSDTMLLFANGAAGGPPLDDAHAAAPRFREALEAVAIALARELAADGEGARTLIEVQVEGGATLEDARLAARTVTASPLVKTMVAGRDANLGRVLMAVGRSGARVDVDRTSVWIGEHCAFERGVPTETPYETISAAMEAPEVVLRVDLGLGNGRATAWGCDLTEDYVRINADYTT
ncbi:MAG: bifunctional glutamate N-acetyltransferase/amino-acid acetyltransferase ArgJ [Dehalococcoidia bacterium]